jgi:hypothetical protein
MPQRHHSRTLNSSRKRRIAKHYARMTRARDAKAAKRMSGPAPEPKRGERVYPLQLGVRNKATGETAWTDLRSVRDAAKRLAVVLKYYLR